MKSVDLAYIFARFGNKQALAERLLKHCQDHEGYEDVAQMCGSLITQHRPDEESDAKADVAFGLSSY